MNELFLRVVNMSLAAAVIGLAVLLFRAAGKRRLPRWVFYAAWGLVLARLLLPVWIPSPVSAFNAIPAAHTRAARQSGEMVFVEDSGAAVRFPTLQTRPAENLSPVSEADEPAAPPPVRRPAAVVAPAEVNRATILSTIWLCGVVLLLAYSAGCYGYTLHRLKTAGHLEHTPELDAIFAKAGISPTRIALYRGGPFGSPVVCGLLRPRLLRPRLVRPRLVLSGLVGEADMAHVLAHELTHIRRRDNLWKALATLALYLHWFNPLVWIFYHFYVTDMEASCDEAVIRDGFDRREYAYSLVGMASKNRSAFAGGFLAFGESALKDRVKSIMRVKKNTAIVTILCVAVLTGLAIIFLTNPQEKSSALSAMRGLRPERLDSVVLEWQDGDTVILPQESFSKAADAVREIETIRRDTDIGKYAEMAFALGFSYPNDDGLVLEFYAPDEGKERILVWEGSKGDPEGFEVAPESIERIRRLVSEWSADENDDGGREKEDQTQSGAAADSLPQAPPAALRNTDAAVPAQAAPVHTQPDPLAIARAALKKLRLQDVTDIGLGRHAPNSQIETTVPEDSYEVIISAVQSAKLSQATEYYLSSEPEYRVKFYRSGGSNLLVTFNTGSITVSEESGQPVQQHYSYTFTPDADSLKPLADSCENVLDASERYLWTQDTVLRQGNPDYLRIPCTGVDCVNLIDRESHTCIRLDPVLAKRVVLAINMVYPMETNVQPNPQNLRMLQIRYKNGEKAEYWMHSNVFMYKDIQLGTVDRDWYTGIADLYYRIGLPDSQQMQDGDAGPVSAEWLGMMNPYRITAMEVSEETGSQEYGAAAGEEQRNAVLQVARKLQEIAVDPGSTLSGDKSGALAEMDNPALTISLEFENGKEQYWIYLFDNNRILITVGSIDYYLAYRPESAGAYHKILDELQLYAVEPKYNPMTAPD